MILPQNKDDLISLRVLVLHLNAVFVLLGDGRDPSSNLGRGVFATESCSRDSDEESEKLGSERFLKIYNVACPLYNDKMDQQQKISKIMNILAAHFNYKERTTLNRMRENPDPFKVLIACLLSLRTQDKNTEKASSALFAVADTPEKILKLSEEELEKIIFSSGHYKKKARTLKHVSKVILEEYNGRVPDKKEELLSIKGIGPKTANIVLAFAYGKSVLPIDTHCHRIPNRLGWVKTKSPEQTEKELEKILPRKYWPEFNALFVLFGQTICQPISPKCSQCPVREYCPRIGVTRSR